MKFEEFNLEKQLFDNIRAKGFEDCTPIQEASIPKILTGSDLSGLAQTGTGKTGAYLLPLVDRILKAKNAEKSESFSDDEWASRSFGDWDDASFILVLVPTRELADQVNDFCIELIKDTGLKSTKIYGGESYDKQIESLNNGVQFIFATPGRLIDLYKKKKLLDLKKVKAVVFDEADRMFDMGFKDDMKYILNRIPKERQFLIFSATLNFEVTNIAYSFGADPIEVDVSRDQITTDNIDDYILHVGQDDKPHFLVSILKKEKPRQVIVFCNFKVKVERISQMLNSNGFSSMGISSLLSQARRQKVIEKLKSKNENYVLVATDVAARGLDIKEVDLVVNFELPEDSENYVHRIGRTGRAGAKGVAVSLVGSRDVEALGRIESYLDNKLEVGWLDDADLVPKEDFKPMPRSVRMDPVKGNSRRGAKNTRSRSKGPGSGKPREKYEGKPKHKKKSKYKKKTDYKSKNTSSKPSDSSDSKNKKFKRKSKTTHGKNIKKVYSSGQGSRPGTGGEKSTGGKVSRFLKKLFG